MKAGHVGICPEEIHLNSCKSMISEPIHIKVNVAELLGNEYHIHSKIVSKVSEVDEIKAGDELDVVFDLTHIHLYDKESEECIY